MSSSSSSDVSRPQSLSGVLALGAASFGFSWGFILVKVAGLPAAWTAFYRVLFGAVVLTIVAFVRRTPWLLSGVVLTAGVCFGLHQLFFIRATQITSIALITLIAALQPLVVGVLSRRMLGEAVPRGLWGCAALALAGVGLVVYANRGLPTGSALGVVLALLNLASYSTFFLASKRARALGAHSLTLTAASMGFAVLPMVPLLIWGEQASAQPWQLGVLLLMAVGPGNCHLLVNWAHSHVSAALASIVLGLTPVFASLWAHLFFDEPFGPLHVAGTLLTLLAVELGRRQATG